MTALVSAIAATVLGGVTSVGIFWTMQRWRRPTDSLESREFAENLAFRIGAMHALVLAVSFSVIMSDYEETEEVLDEEIVTVGKLLSHYKLTGQDANEARVKQYIDAVVSEGLDAKRVSSLDKSDQILIELLERSQLDRMDTALDSTRAIGLIETLRAHRIQRAFDLHQGLPAAFWLFGVLGYVLILYAMTVYPPNAFRLELVFAYGALVALLLYLIYEMGTPFTGAYRLEPTGFQHLIEFYDYQRSENSAP